MQGIAAATVAGIMGYVIWRIKNPVEGVVDCVPEQYWLLLAAAIASLVRLVLRAFGSSGTWTTNGVFSLVWAAALILYSLRAEPALTSSCSMEEWHTAEGVTLCRLSKPVVAATAMALICTVGAFIIDVKHRRRRGGQFAPLNTSEQNAPTFEPTDTQPVPVPMFDKPYDPTNRSHRLSAAATSEGRARSLSAHSQSRIPLSNSYGDA